ncbi:MAG TPA: hypothetical protein VI248_18405 [Kineosporiaceae bacterium]
MATALTQAEVLALPASVPLVRAGRAVGLGESATREAHRAGTLPFPVLRVGAKNLIVPRAAILRVLGLEDVDDPAATRTA